MKNIHKIIIALFSLVFLLPTIIFAANSLIPCSGVDCNFSSFAALVNNVINWFLSISATVAAITFSWAGIQMLLNPDNPGKRQDALEMFKKTVIGMIIILVAWLVIHTIIVTLLRDPNSALRFLGK